VNTYRNIKREVNPMLTLFLLTLSIIIATILYCCIHISTTYDKEINDLEQEKFIKEHKKQM